MSPPIYTPDGSEVSEIVLPDGSTASQVIGPDGNVVFEAPRDIPDSAVSQYLVDEGFGSTLNNEYSSQPDGTIDGADWFSDSSLEGGYGLDFVSSNNDHVDIGSTFDFVGSSTQYAFCVTVNMDDLSASQVIWNQYTSSDNIHTVGTGLSSSGELGVGYYDGSWSGRLTTSATTNRLRLGVNVDSANKSFDVSVDGSIVDDVTGHPSGTTISGNMIGGQVGGKNFCDMTLDNPIWYDSLLSESEFNDDYSAQPWS